MKQMKCAVAGCEGGIGSEEPWKGQKKGGGAQISKRNVDKRNGSVRWSVRTGKQ